MSDTKKTEEATENKATFTPKEVLLELGSLTVSKYTMTTPTKVGNDGKTIPSKEIELFELMTIKEKWSKDIRAFYKAKAFINITADQMLGLIKGASDTVS